MSDNTYYTQLNVALIEGINKRISDLEQKLKDRELEETLDIGRMASKDWVDSYVTSQLRHYKEK